jgi:preprotein translocase subunit SecG
MGLMAALGIVAAGGLPIFVAPLVAAAATGAGSPYPPSVAATTPRLVADADLPAANALRSAIGAAGIVAGPALGAVLLLVASPSVAILANAGTFAVSALLVASIGAGPAFAPSAASAEGASVLADLREGAAALCRSRPVLLVLGADIAASAVYGAQTVLLVVLARRLGGDGYGLLIAAIGAGGLVGASLASRAAALTRPTAVLVGALLAVAVPMALLAAAPSLPVAMALVAAGGAGAILVEVLAETRMQRLLDEAVLARAYGLALPAALGGIVAGALAAAPLQSALGLGGALVACGGAVALYAIFAGIASARPAPVAEPAPTVS